MELVEKVKDQEQDERKDVVKSLNYFFLILLYNYYVML